MGRRPRNAANPAVGGEEKMAGTLLTGETDDTGGEPLDSETQETQETQEERADGGEGSELDEFIDQTFINGSGSVGGSVIVGAPVSPVPAPLPTAQELVGLTTVGETVGADTETVQPEVQPITQPEPETPRSEYEEEGEAALVYACERLGVDPNSSDAMVVGLLMVIGDQFTDEVVSGALPRVLRAFGERYGFSIEALMAEDHEVQPSAFDPASVKDILGKEATSPEVQMYAFGVGGVVIDNDPTVVAVADVACERYTKNGVDWIEVENPPQPALVGGIRVFRVQGSSAT